MGGIALLQGEAGRGDGGEFIVACSLFHQAMFSFPRQGLSQCITQKSSAMLRCEMFQLKLFTLAEAQIKKNK